MKSNKFNLILTVLTLLMGIFLYFEFQLDKDNYHQEEIKTFHINYNKILDNYDKNLKYSLLSHLQKTEFKTLLAAKDSKKIDMYLYLNYSDFLNNEFRYLDIYDTESELVYSLNDTIKDSDNNKVLNLAVENERKTQGYLFTKTVQSYRFVYPIYLNNKIIAYIDFGIAIDKLLENLAFDGYDRVDILIDKGYIGKDVSKIKYKENAYSNRYYNLDVVSSTYDDKLKHKIQKELDEKYSKKDDFVVDILSEDVFFNQLVFLKLDDANRNSIGYLVNYSNNKSLTRIIVLQVVKFSLIVLMVSLLYSLYRKNQESNYFSKQLLDALYKVNIVSRTDLNGIITSVNKNFTDISGYKEEELIGQNHNIVRHQEMPKEFYKKMWDTINDKKIFNDIITNKRKDGSAYYVNSTIIPILDTKDNIKEFIAFRNDVGTLINATKLLSEDIKFVNNPCCVNIKIDQFEMYSSIYPQEFLLKLERILFDEIKKCVPDGLEIDKIYNLLDGQYSFIFERTELELDKITILLKKLLQNLNSYEIVIDSYLYKFNFLIAYTTEAEHCIENQKIAIRNMSLNISKENLLCSNGFAIDSHNIATKNLETMKMIEDALNTGNLISHFQAIYNINDKRIEKYESLVRIKKEDKIISPYFFMNVAKKTGLYKRITIKVLENSFAILDKIDEEVTINLSAADIEDIDIRNLLLGYFTTPSYYGRVTFEFLEDETIGDFELINKNIHRVSIRV